MMGAKLVTYPRFDTALMNGIEKELGAFLEKYSPDGLFFTNYDFPESDTAFADYMNCGGGMSYQDYLDGASRQVVELASSLVRKKVAWGAGWPGDRTPVGDHKGK